MREGYIIKMRLMHRDETPTGWKITDDQSVHIQTDGPDKRRGKNPQPSK